MTDQQRGDTIFPYSRAIMPNVEKLCKDGVTFAKTYTIAPHCCPSRATFFSGLYPSQHGVWNNVNVGNGLSRGLYDGVKFFSEDLRAAGYHMYFSGRWHVSHVESPLDRGFHVMNFPKPFKKREIPHKPLQTQEWEKLENGHHKVMREEGEIQREGYGTYVHYGVRHDKVNHDNQVVTDAIEVMKTRAKSSTPWCHYIGTVGPHDAYFVPQKYLDMYDLDDIELPKSYQDLMKDKPQLYRRTRDRFDQLTEREHKEAIRHYLALCTYEDDIFGQVLDALQEQGEAENTLVLYLSDHGDYNAEHGLWCKGLPCFKGAYHIPAAMRWPKGIKNPGRVIDDFVCLADFAPTFLDISGTEVDRTFTGYSLAPYLYDEQPRYVRDAHYTQTNGNELYGIQRSIMTKEWKFVYNGFAYDELYDLKSDPDERYNLLFDDDEGLYQEVVNKLSYPLWKFAKEVEDPCVNQYITVGLATPGPGIIFAENKA